jgi:hypothetical protein
VLDVGLSTFFDSGERSECSLRITFAPKSDLFFIFPSSVFFTTLSTFIPVVVHPVSILNPFIPLSP